jgi:hypothetical protein
MDDLLSLFLSLSLFLYLSINLSISLFVSSEYVEDDRYLAAPAAGTKELN